MYWRHLRLCCWTGSVVTDYRILRNKTHTLGAV
ncbi:YlcG family protein [Dryocola sp. BD613]